MVKANVFFQSILYGVYFKIELTKFLHNKMWIIFFFGLWNKTVNLWFNLKLMLQTVCSEPLYFIVI